MTTTPITSFGNWVRRQRKALDLTQAALAQRIGCAVVTIRKIERDERRPSAEMAALLAQHLAISETERQDFLDMGRGRYVDELEAPTRLIKAKPTTNQIPHNLPSQATPFIGRKQEIKEIAGYLNDPTRRLITILGPGGMGKTRLALAVGERVVRNLDKEQNRPMDGVFFVPLASVDEPTNMVQSIATAMTLSLDKDSDRRQQLVSYLKRKHLLLLMDNCEHLLDGIDLFTEIMQAAPHVQIMATSRERLLLQGEQLFFLSGLDVPSKRVKVGELDGTAFTSVQLFQEAAERIQPHFSLDRDTLPSVIEICRLVAGMPLGIELAAGWLDVMLVTEIESQLRGSLDFLESEARNLPERHRSMRAIFTSSWQQMQVAEQDLFTKLSVFRGGFSRAAAKEVAGATIHQLSRLQSKSLLQFDQEKDRFQIHELLRQFGVEKLAEDKERETAVRSAHTAYFCTFLHERETAMKSAGVILAIQEIDAEIDNVRRAWDWAVDQGDFTQLQKATESLGWFYHWPSRHEEGLAAFAKAADKMEAVFPDLTTTLDHKRRVWTRLLSWQASFSENLGQRDNALLLCQKALDSLIELEETNLEVRSEKAYVFYILAEVNLFSDLSTNQLYGEQSLALYREIDDQWGIVFALINLGRKFQYDVYDNLQAESYYREAWQLMEILDHPWQKMWLLINWGRILATFGRLEEGDRRLRQARTISIETGYNPGVFYSSLNLAIVTLDSGQFKQGQTILNEAISLHNDFEEVGFRFKSLIYTFEAIAFMHLGDYDRAEASAMHSVINFDKLKIRGPSAWGSALIASVKLVEDKHGEAQTLLKQVIHNCREINVFTHLIFARLLQTYSFLKQDRVNKATETLVEVLEFALPQRNYIHVLMAVAADAFYHALTGRVEKAITLYALAQSHAYVGNSRWFADLFGQPIAEIAATLPEAQVKKAEKIGRSLDLWETAEALLEELKSERLGSLKEGSQ